MKLLRAALFASFALALALSLHPQTASASDSLGPACDFARNCYCPQVIDPVCGVDGETYTNSCYAACECVDVAYPGKCGECSKICDGTKVSLVCGEDGNTYANICYAKCAGVTPVCGNACEEIYCSLPK
jgi:hypothetical protein